MIKKNYKQLFNLKNKKIILVGGFGLLGSEIVRVLSDLNAEITILDNLKNNKILKEFKTYNLKIKYIKFDCSNLKKAEKQIQKLINKNYIPDAFINCSYPRTKDWYKNNFKNIKLQSYEKNISIHLNSYIWLSRVFAESIIKFKKEARIINFSSIYGILGQDLNIYKKTKMRENMTYSVIKGGIINFTRQMASYYGRNNLLVNCICPGGVYGPVQGLSLTQDKHFLKNYSQKVPLNRLAHSHEIASVVAFLCSDASSYITGTSVIVDGGWSSV